VNRWLTPLACLLVGAALAIFLTFAGATPVTAAETEGVRSSDAGFADDPQPPDSGGVESPPGTPVGGVITEDTTWDLAHSPYVMTENVTVNNGVRLTIEAGVVVQASGAGLTVHGALRAAGRSGQSITFTTAADPPAPGQWGGILFEPDSDDARNLIEYVSLGYAGGGLYSPGCGGYSFSGIGICDAAPTIRYTTVHHSVSDGIWISGAGQVTSAPKIDASTFTANGGSALHLPFTDGGGVLPTGAGNAATNNSFNGLAVDGTLAFATTLAPTLGLPLGVTASHLTVNHGAELTVASGTTVLFSGTGLIVHGALRAVGTSDLPITFTTAADPPAPGQWEGITFEPDSDDARSLMEYLVVSYSGRIIYSSVCGGVQPSAAIFACDSAPTVRYSAFHHNFTGFRAQNANSALSHNTFGPNNSYGIQSEASSLVVEDSVIQGNESGIRIQGGALAIKDSVIQDNEHTGIRTQGGALTIESSIIQNNGGGIELSDSDAAITNCSIIGNQDFGVQNSSASRAAIARYNWWGHPSGPYQESTNPNGKGSAVSDYVAYDPWLMASTAREATALTLGQSLAGSVESMGFTDYRLATTPGQSLVVELTPLNGAHELWAYGRFEDLPLWTLYDTRTQAKTSRGTYELMISPTQEGTYYFTVYGQDVEGIGGGYTIVANQVTRHLSGVSPRTAGNAGGVTLQLAGVPFVDGMQVELRASGRPALVAGTVTAVSPTELRARFDLLGATPGTYDAVVIWPDESEAGQAGAFTITQGGGPRLEVRLSAPQVLRPGHQDVLWLEYANTGDVDLQVPMLIVSSPSQTLFGLEPEGVRRDSVQLLGLNPYDPVDALPPGISNRIPLYFMSTPHTVATFELRAVQPSDAPVNWDSIGAGYRPSGYEVLMDTFWQRVRSRFGTTWAEYLAALTLWEAKNRFPQEPTYSVPVLFDSMLHDLAVSGYTRVGEQLPIVGVTEEVQGACGKLLSEAPVTLWLRNGSSDYVPLTRDTVANTLDLPMTIIIHGMNNCRFTDWVEEMADAAVRLPGPRNVIVVDWGALAQGVQSGRQTLKVGSEVATILRDVFKESLDPKRIHIIGHSYGSYVGAEASVELGRVARLTTLEPARQAFVPGIFKSIARFADFTDSYKSSSFWSAPTPQGRDSFILPTLQDNIMGSHSYAHQWFLTTATTGSKYGWGWTPTAREDIVGPSSDVLWLGVIKQDTQGNVKSDRLVGWDLFDKNPDQYPDKTQWRYGQFVPAKSYEEMLWNLSKSVELKLQTIQVTPNAEIEPGQDVRIEVEVTNNADNRNLGLWSDAELLKRQSRFFVQLYLSDDGQSRDYRIPAPFNRDGGKLLPGDPSLRVPQTVTFPQAEDGTWYVIGEAEVGGGKHHPTPELYMPNNNATTPVTVRGTPIPTPSPTPVPTPSPDDDYPEPPPGPVDGSGTTRIIRPIDPNEKLGPPGVGPLHVVRVEDDLRYTIYFENVITATAPAQEVIVTDNLDPSLDWSTLDFAEIAFGDQIIAAAGDQFTTRQVVPDYRAEVSKSWWVDVTAQLNRQTGRITWAFRTLDPETEGPPDDPLAGFLPPNDDSGRGEGHVSFAIRPKADAPMGTTLRNKASIVFDINEAIGTNEVWNTIGIPGATLATRYLPLVQK
jgi:uncharacterized repeat protein (TIGR01451 family)